MSGRFLSQKDMSAARHSEEIFNSMKLRNEVKDVDRIRSQRHVVCGCGAEGCIFISCVREEKTPQSK